MVLKLFAMALLLLQFLFPFWQVAFYPNQVPGLWMVLPGIGMLLAMAGALYFYRKNRAVKSCIWFFIIGAVAGLFFASHPPALFLEQDAYVPYMGLYLLAGLALNELLRWIQQKNIIYVVPAVLLPFLCLVMLAYQSFQRVKVYSDSESLWTEVIEKHPGSDHAFLMRGNFWAMNGLMDKAKFDYQQCIRLNENAYEAMNNIGLIHLGEGEPNYALTEFNHSIEVRDDFYKSYLNRGITYMRMGKNDLAMNDMRKAVELEPNEPLVWYNRGLLFERMNQLQDAISDFSVAISLDPYRYIFYKDRGKAYVWMSKFQFAELDYSKALDLDPTNAEMWFRRSLARVSQDKIRGGLEDAFMAKKLGFPVEEEYLKGLTVQILKEDSVLIE
jgi:tetratricopeptide (TPR) repeat protein